MVLFNSKKKFKSLDHGYFDVLEILNHTEGETKMNTYHLERQNKKAFNWGFLGGVLFSAACWIVVIYLLK